MKKLMFGAALAATSMAFAAQPAAQVYDVTLNIKSTKAASAKINDNTNPVATDESYGADGKLYYRTQASYTWKGLIWGCNCEAINGVWDEVEPCTLVWNKETKQYEEVIGEAETVKGCILWDTKGKAPVYMGKDVNVTLKKIDVTGNPGWGWDMLQLIDKKGTGVEAKWTICGMRDLCDEDQETFNFTGAGFGTVVFVKSGDEIACNSYVKKITGNFAGVMRAPTFTQVTQKAAGCSFCGSDSEETECDYVLPWTWCEFGSACGCDIDIDLDEDNTAAYGTWTIAYNSSLSKKLSNTDSILNAYNFKSLPDVSAAIAVAEAQILGIQTTCDELEAALATAKANTKECEAAVEAVSREALTTKRNVAKAQLQYVTEQYNIEALEAAYGKALYMETNLVADIAYTNTVEGGCFADNRIIGCDALESKINSYDNGTNVCLKIGTSIPGLYDDYRTCATWAQGRALVTERRTATANAKTALESAELAIQTAEDDLAIAETNLANCDILTASAEAALEKAEAAEAVAQAAYDDAGCSDAE